MRKILLAAAISPLALLGLTTAGANPPAHPTEQPKPADDGHHDDGHHDDGKGGDHNGEKPQGDHH